jgi:methylated-DNA-protein-cysteine methyltransferase-like protein
VKKDISDSYARIWQAVREIPRGRVATYGQVAEAAGLGKQARQAGYALHALPKGTDVPWHRVINAQGKVSFPPGTRAYKEQRKRLEAEGVVFLRGRIDLDRYGRNATLDEMLWKPGR